MTGRSSGESAWPGGGQQAEETGELRAAQRTNTSQEGPSATPLSSQRESRAPMGVGGVSRGQGQSGEGGVSRGGAGERNLQVEMSGCREGGEARWVGRGRGYSCR